MLKFLSSIFRRKPSAYVKKNGHIKQPAEIESAIQSSAGCTVVNAEKANYSNIKRINYRIIVSPGVTDAHLLRIFKELDIGKYDEVTVWCYKSIDEIRQYQSFTVAMLEKTKKTGIHITRV